MFVILYRLPGVPVEVMGCVRWTDGSTSAAAKRYAAGKLDLPEEQLVAVPFNTAKDEWRERAEQHVI
jgi:hypothetical protein